MGKLTFLAGMAAGYVLGAKAGRQRYEQIRRTSGKVWNSQPVQKQVPAEAPVRPSAPVQQQVAVAKEAARTKAAPVVADLVADAARATGERLRQGRTIASEAIHDRTHHDEPDDAWASATRSGTGD